MNTTSVKPDSIVHYNSTNTELPSDILINNATQSSLQMIFSSDIQPLTTSQPGAGMSIQYQYLSE